MNNDIKKKLKIPILLLVLILLIFPLVSSLTIENTTFHTSISNYTVHVDNMTLEEVNVTNLTISLYNLTSIGSNFTNINNTYEAKIDFYGLDTGLVVRNINTSTDLFESVLGNQDYNATFSSLQIVGIRGEPIVPTPTYTCTAADRALLNLTTLLFALLIMALPLGILFHNGTLSTDIDIKKILIVFIGIILGIIFIREIANSIFFFCG